MGTGAATGAIGGVASSLSSDAAKKFVDGEEVTWKQMAGHALCGATIGAVAGAAGGAVTKAVVGSHTSAASATLEGEIGRAAPYLNCSKAFRRYFKSKHF